MINTEHEFFALYKDFLNKDIKALAKLVTLLESDALSQKKFAALLTEKIKTNSKKSLVLAISGPPGVGKSTFINALGEHILKYKESIGILTIDPSSNKTKGSILADKLRMPDLVKLPNVYIRPSSSKGIVGGLNPSVFSSLMLMKAFGFPVIIIETVGTGQSEYLAYGIADYLITLVQPGSGDFWQSIKKGILEFSDFIVVNKCDGAQEELAKSLYTIFSSSYEKVFRISSTKKEGFESLWHSLAGDLDKDLLNAKKAERFNGFFDFCLELELVKKLMPMIKNSKNYNLAKEKILNNGFSLNSEIEKVLDEVLKTNK